MVQVHYTQVSEMFLQRTPMITPLRDMAFHDCCLDPMTFQDDHKSYLYNTKHELVTPLFDGTSGETDVIPLIETSSESMRLLDVQLNADFVHYSDWLKSHNISSNSPQESREVIRAIEKKKAAIGPGLDRGGCILITEEMRHNFVQNPGIRRIIANDKS